MLQHVERVEARGLVVVVVVLEGCPRIVGKKKCVFDITEIFGYPSLMDCECRGLFVSDLYAIALGSETNK